MFLPGEVIEIAQSNNAQLNFSSAPHVASFHKWYGAQQQDQQWLTGFNQF